MNATQRGTDPVVSPVVSVVMAAYRGAHLVRATWDSLAAQTFPHFELVVVDDCSPDATLDVLRAIDDPRVTVIAAETNGGPVAARNRAFALSRGRYIAGLDQDDLCTPDRLARQVAYLDASPGTVLVAAAARRLTGQAILPGTGPAATTPASIAAMLDVCNPIVWSSVLFRREAALAVAVDGQMTRTDRLYAEDFDLYHRLGKAGTIARIDDPLIVYRLHAGGASLTGRETMIGHCAAVLADAHAGLFGAEAPARALLLARHASAGLPVPGEGALRLLGDTLARVHTAFLARAAPNAADRALIEGEHARRWWRIVRAAVRSGSVTLAAAAALRPAGIPRGDIRRGTDLLLSHVIGRGRAFVSARRG